MSGTEQEITELLEAWAAAEVAGDPVAMGELVTDRFTAVGPLGFTLSKSDWVERHATGALKYETFGVDETTTRFSGDTAVVIGRINAVGAFRGNPVPAAVRATAVIDRTDGAWRLDVVHMSFIAGTPGAPPIPGRPA
ncbi:nuclear transport factor 2 family protein [Pseudonocardia sp. TRM90224]|uniref:nuclear transport factor 2 family protein n=1 Tax=Pseudonocardia sp. TRM90224 TaxID=2812678 RepID=UPI001E56C895|nr:nuclear transport factor 2 family protein [Pseudonocardia sp. TRM90224]